MRRHESAHSAMQTGSFPAPRRSRTLRIMPLRKLALLTAALALPVAAQDVHVHVDPHGPGSTASNTDYVTIQQALDHLASVLNAKNVGERASAERNARAFLNRMTRLQEAKGTIANEVQRVDAGLKQQERKIRDEGGQL